MWATLLAALLASVTALAAGCAAGTASGGQGAPAASQSGTGQGGNASGPAPGGSGSGQPGSAGPVPTVTATGAPAPGEPKCANWPSGAPQGPLPASFVPVKALRCVLGTTTVQGKGVYASATLESAAQDLGSLADALRRPSERARPGGMACPAIAMIAPQLVLIAADGSMISPRMPVDQCGIIQPGVLSALAALPWQTVSVRLLSPLQ
jgi:hypothetical protein